jgi:hypothetical protein
MYWMISVGNYESMPPQTSLRRVMELLGALGGSLERGVDEVSGNADDVGRLGCDHCRSGSALLFFLLQLVTQSFAFAKVFVQRATAGCGQGTRISRGSAWLPRAGTGFALDHLTFELVDDFFDIPAAQLMQVIGSSNTEVGFLFGI